jgi:hypothetical protein
MRWLVSPENNWFAKEDYPSSGDKFDFYVPNSPVSKS